MKKTLLLVLISLCSFNVYAEYKVEGWTPRYVFLPDDNMIGRAHYFGVSYFKRLGGEFRGPTVRTGIGEHGEKLNVSWSNGTSFVAVDMGLTYNFLDSDSPRQLDSGLDGLSIELGLRLWVVQLIAQHSQGTSFVSLGYGF